MTSPAPPPRRLQDAIATSQSRTPNSAWSLTCKPKRPNTQRHLRQASCLPGRSPTLVLLHVTAVAQRCRKSVDATLHAARAVYSSMKPELTEHVQPRSAAPRSTLRSFYSSAERKRGTR
ncbi:hypothetical protein PsYK624_156340 [Phanerochaete sordida]|uniref:Uncharacterized protein n=1 Tax=Phanerochaete sordida TaxID=48140 RepID=A0A9P3GPL9_9APHY|nr:hypothetical protein PsYK624_156340 [Phanerochaete sordida]